KQQLRLGPHFQLLIPDGPWAPGVVAAFTTGRLEQVSRLDRVRAADVDQKSAAGHDRAAVHPPRVSAATASARLVPEPPGQFSHPREGRRDPSRPYMHSWEVLPLRGCPAPSPKRGPPMWLFAHNGSSKTPGVGIIVTTDTESRFFCAYRRQSAGVF